MKVFKFGGASVKDADAVRNVASVLARYPGENLVVVISAMGKTTNAMEALLDAYFDPGEDWEKQLRKLKDFHSGIMYELFGDYNHPVFAVAETIYEYLRQFLGQEGLTHYDYIYDQVVPCGELLSTKIVHAWLEQDGFPVQWFDARKLIRTDASFREGRVDWEGTAEWMKPALQAFKKKAGKKGRIGITQGFIAGTDGNRISTLGREGSDYTAGIIAYTMVAEEVVIWKDVPGMLNADPKWFNNTLKLSNISYREAIELAYYGASVIHPKTIKPLQNKNIPLWVKSFLEPDETGSLINDNTSSDSLIPSYIFKVNQTLISVSPRDFSFIGEDNLRGIFDHFAKHSVKINTMQNSAIQFSVSVDHNALRIPSLIEALQKDYAVRYNENLELLTIRHYDQKTIDLLTGGKTVLLEQKSRNTVRILMKGVEDS